jgi:hypothetical protein
MANGQRAFLAVVASACATLIVVPRSASAIPTPDHVVIVVEENHSASSILGNTVDAPYLNTLASQGVSFTNFFAIAHPSQPNYLQFFSGSHQGVTTDNSTIGVTPFNTPNLAASLAAAGRSFAGYSEDMPSVGYTGDAYLNYVRRHNPWVMWQNDVTPTANQLPSSSNQPFTGFPTTAAGFAALPAVSVVVPNLQNDMHDGTIAQADAWLSSYIEPYRNWAMSNNSLLIVTWDEDNHLQNNQIPTIMAGPMVQSGAGAVAAASQKWSLHNLLRTVGDMYGAAAPGSASRVAPITGVWQDEPAGGPPRVTQTFRQGNNGYTGAKDTYVESANPATAHATATVAVTDGSPLTHSLVRFDNVIGFGAAQVEPHSQILRATLSINTGSATADNSGNFIALHKMLAPWGETDTWNSLVGGVSADGVEAALVPDTSLTPELLGGTLTFDVTQTLQEWSDGQTNYGWAMIDSGTDAWRWITSDNATLNLRPTLEVTYVPEPAAAATLAILPLVLTPRRRR